MFGTDEQRADRHDRYAEPESEALCDTRRRAQAGKRAGPGAERHGVASGERHAGFVEQFAHGRQHARTGDGTGRLITDP